MKALGVVANMQPAWLYLDGTTLRQHFGVERLAYFHPYRTLFEQGVTVGGGSDHMQKIGSLRSINPYNPFLGMWTTLVRQPRGSEAPLHPEQRLTREQAIRFYTINNAFLDVRGGAERIARAGQVRRLHRARSRHPELPGRTGEGHQGRGDLPWRRARVRAPGARLKLANLAPPTRNSCASALCAASNGQPAAGTGATPLMSSHSASTTWNTSAGSHW